MKSVSHAKFIFFILLACLAIGVWFVHSEIYSAEAQHVDQVTFEVKTGESAAALATRLEQEQIVRHARLFRWYLSKKHIDRRLHAGEYTVEAPITIARVAQTLQTLASQKEREITIIPGWTLRDIAAYIEKEQIGTADELYAIVGKSAEQKRGQVTIDSTFDMLADLPKDASLEGYLAPDTYRIFVDEPLIDVVDRLLAHRNTQITAEMRAEIQKKKRTIHEVLTVASLLEREVPHEEDMAKVADLFWRRYDAGWGMQADSTVHYIFGKKGDLFTTKKERESTNPWNTYKYAGLPPGPIATPSVDAIIATIYPEKNDAWYFLTTLDTGEVKYGRSFDEHTRNIQKFLR